MKSVSAARKLVESAIMLAVATILSMIRLAHLPYGGSVTVASMLPVIIIAYRHGMKWGLITGFVFGIIQQLLGLDTLSWVTTWQSILAVILLDYVVAFAVTGFGGVFRGKMGQASALASGALLVGVLRYVCHVISGATVWAGLSIPTSAALFYSLGYNATYMIPETIVTMLIGYYLGNVLDFRKERLSVNRSGVSEIPVLKWAAGLVIAAGLIFDTVSVFLHLQDPESGSFNIRGLSNVNWLTVGLVTLFVVIAAVVMFILAERQQRKD